MTDTLNISSAFKDKRVLVTGHTGFKGSWLSLWLTNLGARVQGYSIDIPTQPSNFEVLGLTDRMAHRVGDVRDLGQLEDIFESFQPEVVFHLAAQALTRLSYDIPQETFHTNMLGTVNVLECIRNCDSLRAAVMVTSDKCYHNHEWVWGYRESDTLGGKDCYSASKACAEIATRAYMESFFDPSETPRVATARAGNVIGGGDWAADRIVPDCVRAFSTGEALEIRSPSATRPWQHVLEPLSGYLSLAGALLSESDRAVNESFNFGPSHEAEKSVSQLIGEFTQTWRGGHVEMAPDNADGKAEAMLLRLNCDKAESVLGWHKVLSFAQTVEMTASWYKAHYDGGADMCELSSGQIADYTKQAAEASLPWAR
ncbi:MAG: CDP-glucose 4,6-dehydratase [Phycisphaerae bacterium]|jgi:CDP-glucose 4,6-dehydratase|nr:CDP-glucose 4,6-dehydratase [Phycisphaerae bacterium]